MGRASDTISKAGVTVPRLASGDSAAPPPPRPAEAPRAAGVDKEGRGAVSCSLRARARANGGRCGDLNKRRVKGSADHPVDSAGWGQPKSGRVSMESLILA